MFFLLGIRKKLSMKVLRNLLIVITFVGILLVGLLVSSQTVQTQTAVKAFPGAEGYGANATGGRGGRVIHVTNLNISGPGSLQAAVNETGARIIVFDVSGVIDGDVEINSGNLTIAGQTAPGAGITIRGQFCTNYGMGASISNLIVRFLRVRNDHALGVSGDAIQFCRNRNFILDHINASWACDEVIDYYEAQDATLQWCSIEEPSTTGHPEGAHNYGFINGPDGYRVSIHHNLFAHNKKRNPALANGPSDVRNNVVYNAQLGFMHDNVVTGGFNVIGNYYKAGPNASVIQPFYLVDDNSEDTPMYSLDNFIDDNSPFIYESINDPWAEQSKYSGLNGSGIKVNTPYSTPIVATHSSMQAYTLVLDKAGCFPRDVVAKRIVQEVKDRTGSWDKHVPSNLMEGLTPVSKPTDTDNDGMPDNWEDTHGLNKNVDDHNFIMPSGYTAIEEYINQLADSLAGGSSDTTSPVVSITAPLSGSTVSGTITISAIASDNIGVVGVQFLVDGNTVGAEDASSPYSISYSTVAVSNGQHTLSAVARDAAGNITQATAVTVTVNNPADTTAPTVTITTPVSGSTLSGLVTVSATATDNVGVAGVAFMVDGSAIGTEDTSSPYSVSFNALTVANGSHTLTARARDGAGNTTTSAGVVITVSNPTCPLAAGGGGWVNQGFSSQNESFTTTLDVTPSATNLDGIVGLSNGAASAYSGYACLLLFDVDGTIKARNGGTYPASPVTFSAGVPYHVRMEVNVATHTYSVYVTASGGSEQTVASNYAFRTEQAGVSALNNCGAIVGGASGTLQICNFAIGGSGGDTTPPVVAMTAPAGGSTVTGIITVSATASDNVGVAGVQFLVDGNALGAENTTSPYSVSLNSSTLTNGTHTISARARDAANNTTTSATVQVVVSNTVSNNLSIIWRNYSTGDNVQWNMNGVTYIDYAWLPKIADTQWKIRAVADFNADGKSDLVWRNTATGQNIVWFMNGAIYVDYVWLPQIADTLIKLTNICWSCSARRGGE